MTTIITIDSNDRATDSRSDINTNFANLNTDKKEVGYNLTLTHSSFSPADATTYYWGSFYSTSASTTGGFPRFYIPKAGTIKSVYVLVSVGGTLGSSETSTMYLRLNNTTDTTISSSVVANSTSQVFSATVSIPVVAGDYIEMKWVTPTWATNPTALRMPAQVYIE